MDEILKCYDDGTIELEDLAALGLVLELFNHAVAERRATLQSGSTEEAGALVQPLPLVDRRTPHTALSARPACRPASAWRVYITLQADEPTKDITVLAVFPCSGEV
ncbi:hypothetical protein ABIB68_007187 [Bradyrhizobium sp. F1.2.2]